MGRHRRCGLPSLVDRHVYSHKTRLARSVRSPDDQSLLSWSSPLVHLSPGRPNAMPSTNRHSGSTPEAPPSWLLAMSPVIVSIVPENPGRFRVRVLGQVSTVLQTVRPVLGQGQGVDR
jgi:hypothetical protein